MSDLPALYWLEYRKTQPSEASGREEAYFVEPFGDSAEAADRIAARIVAGDKTATCSSLWEWEHDREPLPTVGRMTVVLDGRRCPKCIIETTEVSILAFDQVDAEFAFEEGAGDRSLTHWRTVHFQFFARSLPHIGRVPTESMPVVCERFRVVFSP
ncbi:MAG TPA: ASCH domain-containing protein [Pirellulaceae bacterium]|nr:ASCH domain-containing protein [Pirellulaceae bacterium]